MKISDPSDSAILVFPKYFLVVERLKFNFSNIRIDHAIFSTFLLLEIVTQFPPATLSASRLCAFCKFLLRSNLDILEFATVDISDMFTPFYRTRGGGIEEFYSHRGQRMET